MLTFKRNEPIRFVLFKSCLPDATLLANTSFRLSEVLGSATLELDLTAREALNYWIVESDSAPDLKDFDISNTLEVVESGQIIYKEAVTLC